MNSLEDKQILLAEKLSNYNEILSFVKDKIPEEEIDIYLDFFKEYTPPKIELYESTKIISLNNEVQ